MSDTSAPEKANAQGVRLGTELWERLRAMSERKTKEFGVPVSMNALLRKYVVAGLDADERAKR